MKQATAPPVNAPLYPELPAGPAETQSVNNTPPDQYFRLQEISRLRKHLEDEKDKRSQLYKKYRRGINAVDAADTALISASMGMGIGGVGLLTTVIAAPVVLGLEIAALGCGLLGVAGKFIGRRLSVKAKKHDECSRRANWTPSQTMSRGHSQMDRSLMKNSALSSMKPKNIPRWRQRSALEHRKLMLQSLSMRRQKTPSSNRAETRPGRVSWRSWLGPELCVPKEHLDAGMLLRMRQREREGWPAPVEPLGRRGGGPSSQGLLVVFPVYTFGDTLGIYMAIIGLGARKGGGAGPSWLICTSTYWS